MKFKKVNDSTALDEKNQGWFRAKMGEHHYQWKVCEVCGKTVQYCWTDWPKNEHLICDACMDWGK